MHFFQSNFKFLIHSNFTHTLRFHRKKLLACRHKGLINVLKYWVHLMDIYEWREKRWYVGRYINAQYKGQLFKQFL